MSSIISDEKISDRDVIAAVREAKDIPVQQQIIQKFADECKAKVDKHITELRTLLESEEDGSADQILHSAKLSCLVYLADHFLNDEKKFYQRDMNLLKTTVQEYLGKKLVVKGVFSVTARILNELLILANTGMWIKQQNQQPEYNADLDLKLFTTL